MRVLLLHNRYRFAGGEDAVFAAEGDLLRRHGHEVIEYLLDNRALDGMGRVRLAMTAVWATRAAREVREILRRTRPDVAHFHNTFALISPSAYYACADAGVPVVQTLHNFRLLCPAATFYRDRHVCEACLGRRVPYPGVLHRCYHGSRAQSAVVAMMLTAHRCLSTWVRRVDTYIALTRFAREKFVQGGLPADRIVVKPNFLDPDPGAGGHEGMYALFVGRLTEDKGLDIVLEAWRRLGPRIPLKVVGTGPLAGRALHSPAGVEWVGQQPRDRVLTLMQDATFLVFPSTLYENFPVTLAEAFATGLPVIASRLGAMAEIVEDGCTGLHFDPGNADALAARVGWALAHMRELRLLGRTARETFETRYTGRHAHDALMAAYHLAIGRPRQVRA